MVDTRRGSNGGIAGRCGSIEQTRRARCPYRSVFVIEKEEELVSLNRAADGSAKTVIVKSGMKGSAADRAQIISRIQIAILEVLV